MRAQLLGPLADVDGHQGQEELDRRPDEEGIEDGPQAHDSAEEPAGGEHRQLQARAHQPDAQAGALRETGHQAVPRPRTELAADVDRPRRAVDDDPSEEQHPPPEQGLRGGEQRQGGIGGQPDDDRVRHRADPRPLPQRHPEGEHRDAGEDDHRAEGEPGQLLHPVVEDVPRVEPERAAHEHAHRDAVEDQADHQLAEAKGEPAGPELLPRGQRDQGDVASHGPMVDQCRRRR
ncbi:hypothetical protein GCM10022199_15650 [Marihabitans asiaticum]